MQKINPDFLLEKYNFDLPEERIAQAPAKEREDSKLLVYKKENSNFELSDAFFKDIANYLPRSKDNKLPLFIANNSKVLPARLLGKSAHGGKRELLLLSPLPLLEIHTENNIAFTIAEVLLKPARNANINDIWIFDGNLQVEILEKYEFGKHKVRLIWDHNQTSLLEIFNTYGHLPLPPYIKRQQENDNSTNELDAIRYQTTYANQDKTGSVAAPTAGLHFSTQLRNTLLELGCMWEEVTLHVGYGTFTPVRVDDIREHAMHSEYFELPARVAQAILKAKEEGRPIIAIGTTSCRVLEGAAKLYKNQCPEATTVLPQEGLTGSTNIFIYPKEDANSEEVASQFKVISGLITNFHLPESSLLMLVSALVGRENLLSAYAHAIKHDYRFFSYGDAMLIY